MQYFLQEEHHFSYDCLVIRELKEHDTDHIASLFEPTLTNVQAMLLINRLASKRKAGEFVTLLIFERSDTFVGALELYDFLGEQCEIGYRIRKDMQGKGICTKAVAGCLSYLKTYGIKNVVAHVKLDNYASLKLLHRNGFDRILEKEGCITMEVRL